MLSAYVSLGLRNFVISWEGIVLNKASMIAVTTASIALLIQTSPCFAEQTVDQKIFVDKAEGVAFNFPQSWEIRQQRTNAFLVMVGSSNGLGESCMLQTNRNAALQQISSDEFVQSLSPKDIVNLGRQSNTDLNIINFKRTKVGNRPAIFYEASSIYQSLSSQFPIRLMTVILKVDERMYSLGCTAHAAAIDAARPTFMNILKSLTVRL